MSYVVETLKEGDSMKETKLAAWQYEALRLSSEETLRVSEIARRLKKASQTVESFLIGYRRKLTPGPLLPEDKAEIVRAYTEDHLTCSELGIRYGKSRVTINKVLQSAGVSASQGERVDCVCSWCGQLHSRTRARWRAISANKSQLGIFCTDACRIEYLRAMGSPSAHKSRHGQRRGRDVVEGYCGPLPSGYVVHHKDQNQYNNDSSNLLVFRSQSDHLKWHRGDRAEVSPVWDGRTPLVR